MKKKNEKSDVLILCQFFYPEFISSATLPFDTASYLSEQGLGVGVMCGYPKEYASSCHVPMTETINGIRIKRLKYIQCGRKSIIGRIINYLSLTVVALFHVSYLKQYRYVMVYSNPPLLPLIANIARRRYGTRFVFVSYDVYPEIAFENKAISKGSPIEKMMNYVNSKIFPNAERIVTLSDEMKDFLLKNRTCKGKEQFVTIPNWPHESYTPDAKTVPDAFTVSYFGNMGTCQDMDTILDAAKLLRDRTDIKFILTGHGNKVEAIKKRINNENLSAVTVRDFASGNELESLYTQTSVCVVSLTRGMRGLCAPSKYYSYLQMGKPIVAVVEPDSYLEREISQRQIGVSVAQGEGKKLSKLLTELKDNPEKCTKLGLNARALFEECYTKEIANEKYLKLFTE